MRPGVPVVSVRLVKFTVFPKRQYRGMRLPITPVTTSPEWMPMVICCGVDHHIIDYIVYTPPQIVNFLVDVRMREETTSSSEWRYINIFISNKIDSGDGISVQIRVAILQFCTYLRYVLNLFVVCVFVCWHCLFRADQLTSISEPIRTLFAISIMSNDSLAIHFAWFSHASGIPDTAMYLSPTVSTYMHTQIIYIYMRNFIIVIIIILSGEFPHCAPYCVYYVTSYIVVNLQQ